VTAPRRAAAAALVSAVLAVAVAAVALATVDTAVPALVTLPAVAAAVGVALVVASVLSGWAAGVIGGVAALGVAYAAAVSTSDRGLDLRAPVVAAALFLVAEAALWSHDLRRVEAEQPGSIAAGVAWLAGIAVVTVTGGVGLLAAAGLDIGGGVAAVTVGVVAAVGVAAMGALAVSGISRRG
jgi:hypothetical protein